MPSSAFAARFTARPRSKPAKPSTAAPCAFWAEAPPGITSRWNRRSAMPVLKRPRYRTNALASLRSEASEAIDRRAMRFLGGGSAWNHVAMEQAIRDAGLEETEVSNERAGIIKIGSQRSHRPPRHALSGRRLRLESRRDGTGDPRCRS